MNATVAVGFSPSRTSLSAAEWAAEEAARRGLALRLVHAGGVRPHSWPNPTAALGEEVAGRLGDRHPGLVVHVDEVFGPPAEVLATAAESAELLVLGSRGLGGVTGALLRSVSQATVARATGPVVVVREGARDRPPGDVVLGLDLAHPCDELLDFAFHAATGHAGRLRVVYAWQPPSFLTRNPQEPAPDLYAEVLPRQARALSDALAPWRHKYPEVTVAERVLTGHAPHHLTQAAAGAALLVVGRRPRRSSAGPRVGHTLHALLHHSPAPVAVVPHP